MGKVRLGSIVGACLLLWGCVATKEPPGTRMFTFDFEGRTYAIVSTDAGTAEGNVLLRRDHSQPFLRADDFDQDGVLDTVRAGPLTLAAANRVYLHGLAEAAAQGKRHVVSQTHTFALPLPEGTFVVQTVMAPDERPFNRFLSPAPLGERSGVALDEGADGRLDRVLQGATSLAQRQERYTQVIEVGIRSGQMVKRGERYLVVAEAVSVRH